MSRASMGSQLSAPAGGSWEEAGGRCVVISSGTSAMGDGVLVLLFLLPEADVVVLRPVVLVAARGVVLAVVLPGPRAPDVDTPEIKAELLERGREQDLSLGPEDVPSDDSSALQGATGATTQQGFQREAGANRERSTQGGNDHWSTTDFPKALTPDGNKAARYALTIFLPGILM